MLFVLVWGLGVIIFSAIMYYAEGDKNEMMNSILAARWAKVMRRTKTEANRPVPNEAGLVTSPKSVQY